MSIQFQGSELLPLVTQLQALIKAQTKGKTITEEGSINSQAAFISLKLLCRHIGQQQTDNFVKVRTLKFLNIRTPESVAVICLKFKAKRPNLRVFRQNDANGIANSEDPDQTAPLGAV